MNRNLSLIMILTILSIPLSPQSPYRLSYTVDLPLAGAAMAAFGGSLAAESTSGEQPSEASINPLDRMMIYPYSSGLDNLGTVLSCTALTLPGIAVLAGETASERLVTYAVMYAEAFLLTGGIKDLTKAGISRWRPYTYEAGFEPAEDDDYDNSFPSGHTAYAFLGASFLSATLKAEFPDQSWRVPVSIAAYGLAAGTGALRIASGEHFITDVTAGALLGSAVGWLVPQLHEERAPGESGPAAVLPTGTGLMFSFRL